MRLIKGMVFPVCLFGKGEIVVWQWPRHSLACAL